MHSDVFETAENILKTITLKRAL